MYRPQNVDQVTDAVRLALQAETTLELVGAGSRRDLGRPVQADAVLDLSAISGVILYEPEELILVVAPGTPLEEVQTLIAGRGQHLAFEPPDYGVLWGKPAGAGTIGGAIMTGRNGSRRLTAGGARDHLLGVKGVNGFGEGFAAGGRVVKNVTGFDLPKLLTGSFGTLCAVTELTLKVLPQPPETATLAVYGLSPELAVAAMRRVLNEFAVPVSSAAHLPAAVARDSALEQICGCDQSVTLLRIEGFGPSASAGIDSLKQGLGDLGQLGILDGEGALTLWREVTDIGFYANSDLPVWRISVPPAVGATLGQQLVSELGGRCFYNWAGGELWLECPAAADAHAGTVRDRVRAAAGETAHATLIRASVDVRLAAGPFQPQSPALALITERVRRQFDPRGVFNPGRMYEKRDAN